VQQLLYLAFKSVGFRIPQAGKAGKKVSFRKESFFIYLLAPEKLNYLSARRKRMRIIKSCREGVRGLRCRYPSKSVLFILLTVAWGLSSCAPVAPRPLTIKEAEIKVVTTEPKVTATLEKNCKCLKTIEDVQAKDGKLQWPLSAPCPDFVVSDVNGLRRCAGLYGAQVVEIVSEKKEAASQSAGWLTTDLLEAGVSWAHVMGERIGKEYGDDNLVTMKALDLKRRLKQMELNQDRSKWEDAWWREEGSVTVSRNLRLWQCPATGPELQKGELVKRWPQAKYSWALELDRDGQVVSRALDGYADLRNAVAKSSLAVQHAEHATELGKIAVAYNNKAGFSGVAGLASMIVGVVGAGIGFWQHWPSYSASF
jgi:hypothetical protein